MEVSYDYPFLWIFFDLETTGLYPLMDQIVELGAVAVAPAKVNIQNSSYSKLVKPTRHISIGASMVHNLYDADLVNEEPFSTVLSDFLDWVNDIVMTTKKQTGVAHTPVLIAHNGFKFDFPCLLTEVFRVSGDSSILGDHQIHFSDSLYHFRQLKKTGQYPRIENISFSVQGLYETFFPNKEYTGHRAKVDAEYIRDLLTETEISSTLSTLEVRSLEELETLTKNKQIRSDLRMTFGLKYHQEIRLAQLGLTCDKLQELFTECQGDEICFKRKLEKLGVRSKPLQDELASKLASDSILSDSLF